jgi:ribokinase
MVNIMNEKKIVVIGSSNTDMVIKSESLPAPGETILGGSFLMSQGGKGANQAVAIARLGGDITFVSKIGNDTFGRNSIELYEKEKINIDYIFSDTNSASGIALIMVDKRGENCIAVASGANSRLSIKDIDQVRSVLENADILLMQLEIPMETVEYAAKIAYENGVKVILNPAPAANISSELLKSLYAIIPNNSEAEVISGINVNDWRSAREAANTISSKGVENVIITLGSMGAMVKDGDLFYEVPAKKIEAIDTTAAGDTFCGAFCVGISEGLSILDAVKFANNFAGITVTREGAQPSIPYRDEISIN